MFSAKPHCVADGRWTHIGGRSVTVHYLLNSISSSRFWTTSCFQVMGGTESTKPYTNPTVSCTDRTQLCTFPVMKSIQTLNNTSSVVCAVNREMREAGWRSHVLDCTLSVRAGDTTHQHEFKWRPDADKHREDKNLSKQTKTNCDVKQRCHPKCSDGGEEPIRVSEPRRLRLRSF